MIKDTLIIGMMLFSSFSLFCQDNKEDMTYYNIPDYPENFSSGNIVSRMIDGLGFRFYWATIDLRKEDLSFKPSEEGRTTLETLRHINSLSEGILNATLNKPNEGFNNSELSYEQLRASTLENIKMASDAMKGKNDTEVGELKVKFSRNGTVTEYPFWNLLNGQLSDALWHTGQVVSFRRSSGNPLPKGVSVFRGTKRD